MDEIPSQTPPAPQPPVASRSHKTLFIGLSIFVLFVLLAVAGFLYLGNSSISLSRNNSPQTLISSPTLLDEEGNPSYYTKDDQFVYKISYLGWGDRLKIVPNADPATFKPMGSENACAYYAKDKNHVFYYDDTDQNSELFKYADPKTFTLLKDKNGVCTEFGRDSNHMFFGGKLMPTSTDASTFSVISSAYGKDKNAIYSGTKRLNFDVSTFTLLTYADGPFVGGPSRYVKDKNAVYYLGLGEPGFKVVENADPNTFVVSSDRCINDAKDKTHLYEEGKIITPEYDLISMGMIPLYYTENYTCSDYFKDDLNVYYRSYNGDLTKIEGADPKTFIPLSAREEAGGGGVVWAKDKNHVYDFTSIYEKADPQSFETVYFGIMKDKNQVFLYETPCSEKPEWCLGIDPKTFESLGEGIFKDKSKVYKFGELNGSDGVIKEADLSSFIVLNSKYLKDKNNVYYNDYFVSEDGKETKYTIIKGADPATFKITDKKYRTFDAEDQNHKYFFGKIVK